MKKARKKGSKFIYTENRKTQVDNKIKAADLEIFQVSGFLYRRYLNLIYYDSKDTKLYLGDNVEIMKTFPAESFDIIFADPPYFLSNDGITCRSGEMVSVNKGYWDKISSKEAKHEFNITWITAAKRLLKDNGTIWVTGTLHNIYSVGWALEQCGFRILNNITWQKTNPPPNLACKTFTHSTETVLWACKESTDSYVFHYDLMKKMNEGKQMKDVWTSSVTPMSERVHGKFPTQKPLFLLERILLASTDQNDLVLDPFCGSGTTGVACKQLHRRFIGIDENPQFLDLTIERIINVEFPDE